MSITIKRKKKSLTNAQLSQEVDESVSTLFTENKSSRFLKSACDVGLMVRVAVHGAETQGDSNLSWSFAFLLSSGFCMFVPPYKTMSNHLQLHVGPTARLNREDLFKRNLLLNKAALSFPIHS